MAVNDPIGCGDVAVFPGDVMVGDAEGVVVIPAHLAEEIALEAVAMTAFEDFVTEKVLEGESILGLYPATDPSTETKFNQWRERTGRWSFRRRPHPTSCRRRSKNPTR